MALTPQSRRSSKGRVLALLVLVALLGAACSATPSWIPVESEGAGSFEPNVELAASTDATSADATSADAAPSELAFIDESADDGPSDAFCEATANIWIHSAALNMIGTEATPEMTQIALANIAEWLERSTLFAENGVDARVEMFEAFNELRTTADEDFDFDWQSFQSSTEYANHLGAQSYDTGRADIVSFISDGCETMSMVDLRNDAKARADELTTEFASEPSTVVDSDSLPGHAIFTHSSGRLIASFPTAWTHEEGRGDAIVDLIASPDIERFLNNEAIDGVRIQLIEAATIEDFRSRMSTTMVGTSCEVTNDLSDEGVVRINVTQTLACADHGASIIGQFNFERGLGLIIEASFDRPDASRADLIRLASIANSALWS